tara:strand:+ start:154 stop:609 length:456 start_codon:yes stop_codon:yes gene_type:complete
MLHEKAVKKVEKALGVKVEKMGHRWGCVYDGHVISWLVHPNWEDNTKLEASNWHVRRVDDHSDAMVDYFAGYHLDNVSQLIHAVKPPEPKFPVGTLVRGKANKRATRLGYANRTALVVESGVHMKLSFTDGKTGPGNPSYVTYSERDFMRV